MNSPPAEPNAYAKYIADELLFLRGRGDHTAIVKCDPAWHLIVIEYLTTEGHAAGNVKSIDQYILVLFPENRE